MLLTLVWHDKRAQRQVREMQLLFDALASRTERQSDVQMLQISKSVDRTIKVIEQFRQVGRMLRNISEQFERLVLPGRLYVGRTSSSRQPGLCLNFI